MSETELFLIEFIGIDVFIYNFLYDFNMLALNNRYLLVVLFIKI